MTTRTAMFSALTLILTTSGCGYYRAYRGATLAHVSQPPIVIVGQDATFVTGVVTASAATSGAWSADGWASGDALAGGGASAPARETPEVPSTDRATQVLDVSQSSLTTGVPPTGDAQGLLGILGAGVRVRCEACSSGQEWIAALSLLGPLAGASLGADATLATAGGVRLEASLAHDALPSRGGESAIVLRAVGGPPSGAWTPVRVHLVIDASTSMESRWDEVVAAALTLVDRLRPTDELQVVVYATDARVAFAPARVGDGRAARSAIRGLSCGGRTNIEAGLRAAYGASAPAGGSIVIVLSDGVPQGGLATPTELGALSADARRATGATTLSIGLGNEFHPGILRAIAERGGGEFRVAPRPVDLAALFAASLTAHGQTVARDVELDVELAAGVHLAADLGVDGLDAAVSIAGTHVSVRIPALFAGEARTFVLPISTAHAGAIAEVEARAATTAGGTIDGRRALALGESAARVPAGGLLASLDADLASALLLAGSSVENGDALGASAALRAHVARARASTTVALPSLAARCDDTLALAAALELLVPSAGWSARRQTGARLVEWAGGL